MLSVPEPVPSVLARPHGLLEAPCVVAGGLGYSDALAGGVYLLRHDGEVSDLVPGRRAVGGMAAHRDGGVVVSGRTVVHVSDGATRELHADPKAAGFNDLAADPEGGILVGVLRYRPMTGDPPVPGAVVRIGAGGAVTTLVEGVVWPNGIGLSPDGATGYVCDYAERRVLAFPASGGRPEVFADCTRGSADGLAVDREGGVWVALGEGGAIARFTPGGHLDQIAEVPARFVSSLCFAGEDACDVWITTADNLETPETGGTLFRARSGVAGLPAPSATV